jgi:hypothetical protein
MHISEMQQHTRHSRERLRQRGISPLLLEWLLMFGERKLTNHAEVVYFTKASRGRLRKYIGARSMSKFESELDLYAVIIDGQIVTAGHRTKRLRNP